MVGEVIAGRYELEELIGWGGMSQVYRARDLQLERWVAIKVLHDRYADDPGYVERFRREARAVARLNHPNIVTVIDRGESDEIQYIVFEHIEGDDLKHLVARTGPLPEGRALALAIEIAGALAFAHANGVVHRDVKPQNVLIRDGSAKVADFDIARVDDPKLQGEQTTTGTVIGTGDYMSPEQARGERATEQSDVYSLGVLLYELLAGHVPFPAESAVAAAMRHVSDPVPDMLVERPGMPVRLAAAIERAMAKDPAERFRSMDDFLAELGACGNELPAPEETKTMILPDPTVLPGAVMRLPGGRRPGGALAAVGLLLLLALFAGGAYLILGGHHKGALINAKPGTAAAATVQLTAIAPYDPPPGDRHEGDSLIPRATDGNPATYWETELYTTAQFGNLKQGVGLVVEAGKALKLGSLIIQTGTPGFTAEVKAGASPSGPFPTTVSPLQAVSAKTIFTLHVPSEQRYYLVWITKLTRVDTGNSSKPFAAEIAEIVGS